MKLNLFAPVLLSLLVPLAADARLSSAGGASVAFTAIGPAGMRIIGTSSELAVADDGQSVAITVPLAKLKTGIDLRDRHMRDKYLEVGRFPNAELVVARSAVHAQDGAGDAMGTMKLHGRTKSVPFHYVVHHEGSVLRVSGTVRVDMRDYGIDVPGYFGVKVKPEVDVDVKFGAQE